MLFVDPIYLFIFLPIVCACFYRIGGGSRAVAFLALSSVLFYSGFGSKFLFIFLASIGINAVLAVLMIESAEKKRNRLFWVGLSFNISFICYFKYLVFIDSFHNASFNLASVAIPVGISFYTFQQIGFLLDLKSANETVKTQLEHQSNWRGRARALARFSAYVAFFPQLVIGPIVYLKEYISQINHERFGRLDLSNLSIGITLIVLGLAKKVLADNIAPIVDPVFEQASNGVTPPMLYAWLASIGYFLQLYFDFSGYSDIALGSARIFGIKLPINFDSPLRATGIADYYRRWHITLTRLITRMLFTPIALAGARFSVKARLTGVLSRSVTSWVPLVINFQVIALWHGLSPTFMLFGLYHGLWFVLETEIKATKSWRRLAGHLSEHVMVFCSMAVTFFPLLFSFVLFRSSSVDAFLIMTNALTELNYSLPDITLRHALIPTGLFIVWFFPNTNVLLKNFSPGFITYKNPDRTIRRLRVNWQPSRAWGLVISGLLLGALYMLVYDAPFLYLGF